jgi:hypothetical protein
LINNKNRKRKKKTSLMKDIWRKELPNKDHDQLKDQIKDKAIYKSKTTGIKKYFLKTATRISFLFCKKEIFQTDKNNKTKISERKIIIFPDSKGSLLEKKKLK